MLMSHIRSVCFHKIVWCYCYGLVVYSLHKLICLVVSFVTVMDSSWSLLFIFFFVPKCRVVLFFHFFFQAVVLPQAIELTLLPEVWFCMVLAQNDLVSYERWPSAKSRDMYSCETQHKKVSDPSGMWRLSDDSCTY